jgi:hypothetical protein
LENAANVHTAADLHVRPCFKNRAGLEIMSAANDLRNTRCEIFGNRFDYGVLRVIGRCCSSAVPYEETSF